MQLHTSYSSTFQAALASQTFAIGHLKHIKLPMNIDTSGCYKVFYFVSGRKKFHIDNYVYDIRPGDLFLVNQREWHYFSQIAEEESHERIVIFIYPDYLQKLSSKQTNLSDCFLHEDKNTSHRLTLFPNEQEQILHLIHKISSGEEYGEDILDLSVFMEMMVFLNRVFLRSRALPAAVQESALYQSKQVYEIMTYINKHITEELALETLSEQFYLSPSYLCRIFKSSTGTTIHKYITAKRITLAKDLLTQGHSVTDACHLSGFKDYNGFLKSFVTAVGIPPKKYAQFNQSNSAPISPL